MLRIASWATRRTTVCCDLVEAVGGRVEVDLDAHRAALGELLGGIADGAVEAELLEQRRAELVDEAAHLLQLALEDGAQLAHLDLRLGRIARDELTDDVGQQDRVGERLRRAVVDLLGQPCPLGLLRLQDAHLDLRVGGGLGARRRRPASVPRSRKSQSRSRLRTVSSRRARVACSRPVSSVPSRSWRACSVSERTWLAA